MIQPIKIAPSILAADFAHLAEAVASAEAAGADYIHVDVMDGHFVPNISIGPPVVRALRRVTHLPLDVHLMISNPARYVPAFAEAGADGLTVHVEATPHLHRVLQQIRELGVRPGVSLHPAALYEAILELVLFLAVNAAVLAGAVSAGQQRRTYLAVLYKTLGATRRQVLSAELIEFGVLGPDRDAAAGDHRDAAPQRKR